MIFQISPKLSVARDLSQTYRQTVPQTRPCNSKASVWGIMLEKYHNLQPKPKTAHELKVALTDHLEKAATRTRELGVGKFHQVLDCLHGCICHWWSLRASAVTLSIF